MRKHPAASAIIFTTSLGINIFLAPSDPTHRSSVRRPSARTLFLPVVSIFQLTLLLSVSLSFSLFQTQLSARAPDTDQPACRDTPFPPAGPTPCNDRVTVSPPSVHITSRSSSKLKVAQVGSGSFSQRQRQQQRQGPCFCFSCPGGTSSGNSGPSAAVTGRAVDTQHTRQSTGKGAPID